MKDNINKSFKEISDKAELDKVEMKSKMEMNDEAEIKDLSDEKNEKNSKISTVTAVSSVGTVGNFSNTANVSNVGTVTKMAPLSDKLPDKMNNDLTNNFVELNVYGFFYGPDTTRPVMILKGKTEEEVLPVWLNPSEFSSGQAQLTLRGTQIHKLSAKIFSELGLSVVACYFVDLVGHHQFVELHIVSPAGVKVVKVRADEAMSLCHALGTRFFAGLEYMEKCRNLNAELLELGANLTLRRDIIASGQQYFM